MSPVDPLIPGRIWGCVPSKVLLRTEDHQAPVGIDAVVDSHRSAAFTNDQAQGRFAGPARMTPGLHHRRREIAVREIRQAARRVSADDCGKVLTFCRTYKRSVARRSWVESAPLPRLMPSCESRLRYVDHIAGSGRAPLHARARNGAADAARDEPQSTDSIPPRQPRRLKNWISFSCCRAAPLHARP
jgi:hypothetical protein